MRANNSFLENKFYENNISSKAEICLFCFSHAGGTSTIFKKWKDIISPKIAIMPIKLPGRDERIAEKPFNRMMPLVKSISYALRQCKGMDIAFYGNCLGSLVAFEIARELRGKYNMEPKCLFVCGQEAPNMIKNDTEKYLLDDQAFIEKIKEINGTQKEILDNKEMLSMILPSIRSDFEILETYKYRDGEKLSCPIIAFLGSDDNTIDEHEMFKWQEETSKNFELIKFSGEHFFMIDHEKEIIKAIEEKLLQK